MTTSATTQRLTTYGASLQTETVINSTYDFGVKRTLCNLCDLSEAGSKANWCLLAIQLISNDCPIDVETLDALHYSAVGYDGQASAARFGEPRIQAVLTALGPVRTKGANSFG